MELTFQAYTHTCFFHIPRLIPILYTWPCIEIDTGVVVYIYMHMYVMCVCMHVHRWVYGVGMWFIHVRWLVSSQGQDVISSSHLWIPAQPQRTFPLKLWFCGCPSQIKANSMAWHNSDSVETRRIRHSASETIMAYFFMDAVILYKSYLEKQFRAHNHHFHKRKKCSCDILAWDIAITWFQKIDLLAILLKTS